MAVSEDGIYVNRNQLFNIKSEPESPPKPEAELEPGNSGVYSNALSTRTSVEQWSFGSMDNKIPKKRRHNSEELEEVSDNESEGEEFVELYFESDDELEFNVSSDSEIDETETEEFSDGEIFVARDGTTWYKEHTNRISLSKFSEQNAFQGNGGPTSHAIENINNDSTLSAWFLLIDKFIIDHIIKCTEDEAQVLENGQWSLSKEKFLAYIAILYARGITGAKNLELHSLWSPIWGLNFCIETMRRKEFTDISRFLRFDMKSTCSERMKTNKFAMISDIWYHFIKNSICCFNPGQNIIIGRQLFPSRTRCPFTQFMPSKPDKHGQMFWVAIDLESKYILNAFPYLGKDEIRPQNLRLSEHVVLKLIEPFQNKGRNVIVDNFFTSIKLANQLNERCTTLVGTIKTTRQEIPKCAKSVKNELYLSKILKNEETNATLTVYQRKKNKNILILSTMHSTVEIESNTKKTPKTVSFYNETKCCVDEVDRMTRKYSVKAASRRWPVHSFYYLLDLAAINAWILFRCVTGKNITRRAFIKMLAEELRAEFMKSRSAIHEKCKDNSQKRKKCEVKNCKGNRTKKRCISCNKLVCGKCTGDVTYKCIYCNTD